MKRIYFLSFFFLAPFLSFGQDTIDVVEKNIKIGGLSSTKEYYGFAEGDKVLFNLTTENGKELKDVTISEYPSTVKFADHSTEKVQNKVLNIARNGIYVFEYYNSNVSGRTINVKIQRIPKTESTKFFNSNVKWVNKVDTIYTAREKTYLERSDTSILEVLDSKVRVHSQTNLENPNKTLVDFVLPANTIKWTYWIGVGNEGEETFKKNQTEFLKTGIKVAQSINPLAGLAFGLFTLAQSPVGENVKYYFLPSVDDARKFINAQSFMQFKSGNVVTDFGLMSYGARESMRLYIGLENDNFRQGIDVSVKIVSVVVKNKYNTVVEKVPTYNNISVPVSEN